MILESIKEIQSRKKMTDKEMGASLGLHEKSWSRLKNGRGGSLGIETIRKAVKAYPEIIEPVLNELYGDDYLAAVYPLFKRILAEQLKEEKQREQVAQS